MRSSVNKKKTESYGIRPWNKVAEKGYFHEMRNSYGIGTNLRIIVKTVYVQFWLDASVGSSLSQNMGGTVSSFESFRHSYRHISATYHATRCNYLQDGHKMPLKAARSTTICQLIELHELWLLTNYINLTHTHHMNKSFVMTSKYCHLLHALKGIHTHNLTICAMPTFCFVIKTNTQSGIHLRGPVTQICVRK